MRSLLVGSGSLRARKCACRESLVWGSAEAKVLYFQNREPPPHNPVPLSPFPPDEKSQSNFRNNWVTVKQQLEGKLCPMSCGSRHLGGSCFPGQIPGFPHPLTTQHARGPGVLYGWTSALRQEEEERKDPHACCHSLLSGTLGTASLSSFHHLQPHRHLHSGPGPPGGISLTGHLGLVLINLSPPRLDILPQEQ